MTTISLKVPGELDARLTKLAAARGQTKSHLIRQALEQFLPEESAAPSGSALEAVQRWVGCIEGPGDLSTNPSHMEVFGQ